MTDFNNDDSESHQIASRTRSHVRIDDSVLNDNLNLPDVDMDLYRNSELDPDPEYGKFLLQTFSGNIQDVTESQMDDTDSEYIYNNDIFSHGWRYDFNEKNEPKPEHNADSSTQLEVFRNPEFSRILNHQLRQHIQLLTQFYLLTKHTNDLSHKSDIAKEHLLTYAEMFEDKTMPSNLKGSLDLIQNLERPKTPHPYIRLSWRPLPVPEPVKNIIRNNPAIFPYPHLHPQNAFSRSPDRLAQKKAKISFTPSEDKLLSLALDEFKGQPAQYQLIASLLMTAKTKTQINNHIKNIKRSPGDNPIKSYITDGQTPEIVLPNEIQLSIIEEKDSMLDETYISDLNDEGGCSENMVTNQDHYLKIPETIENNAQDSFETKEDAPTEDKDDSPDGSAAGDKEDLPNESMIDDKIPSVFCDLMTASTTISKNVSIIPVKNYKHLKLKKSTIDMMRSKFQMTETMGQLIVENFLESARTSMDERNYLHLLQLMSDLRRHGQTTVYQEINSFLDRVGAPNDLKVKLILLLDPELASKCGCSLEYHYWMRFLEFFHHAQQNQDSPEIYEKKLIRLVDALQKRDQHRTNLAVGNLICKHPLLKRDFESLSLDLRPHPSSYLFEEDFDDITEVFNDFEHNRDAAGEDMNLDCEHFSLKLKTEETTYSTPSCCCKCHHVDSNSTNDSTSNQHCNSCNLKFMKGRMYLVNKIKPILAEWSYVDPPPQPSAAVPSQQATTDKQAACEASNANVEMKSDGNRWTREEDYELLMFCQTKASQNEDNVSFDHRIFEEFAKHCCTNKSAQEISDRFDLLMDRANQLMSTS